METQTDYEFDQQQNAVFAKLAAAMAFVGIAMLIPGTLLGVAVMLFRLTLLGEAVCGLLAMLLIAIGLLQWRAARHFKRIIATHGSDVHNLMSALGELTSVYVIQRWLWIVLGAVVLIALAGTVTGYSP